MIGPYFFNGTLTGQRYLNFLENELPLLLQEANFNQRQQQLYLQQDGGPAHNSAIVRDFLNRVYPERWIGTNGHIRWPARSPDLSPLDYFLWGYLKNVVYQTPTRYIEDLQNKIRLACAGVTQETLRAVTNDELIKRYEMCVQNNGETFEHLI